MRKVFAQTLLELAQADERVMLLTADLGFGVLDEFAAAYPARFLNVGVAEANMVGVGTGLAEAGFIPFLYSISTFAALRPYEQWRNGPVLHQLPVRLVGIGGGFEYGANGITHMGLEDYGIMRRQPGLTTIAPADARQARAALQETYALPGPIYYRIGKNDDAEIPGLDGRFDRASIETVLEGKEVRILAVGSIAGEAVAAAQLLHASGVDAAAAIVSTLGPTPATALRGLLERFPFVITVESHFVAGGLGSMVAETIAENSIPCRLLRCGVDTMPSGISGSEAYMNRTYGLGRDEIAQKARALLAP